MSLQGKVAIVTGGGQGIGKAIAKRFLEENSKVVIAEIDAEAGRETAAQLHHLGEIQFIETDVSQEESVKSLIEAVVRDLGRIDILVNNAALAAPENPPVEELSLAEWNQTLAVNLTGVFLCTKYTVPHLRKTKGAIVNIASTRALMSEANTEAYSTTKGGVLALTHALANSLGPEIRVNCISPGWIAVSEWQKQAVRHPAELTEKDHQQHPVGRVGKPEDVAALAAYFVSPEASFITGANFIVDGGMSKKMIYL